VRLGGRPAGRRPTREPSTQTATGLVALMARHITRRDKRKKPPRFPWSNASAGTQFRCPRTSIGVSLGWHHLAAGSWTFFFFASSGDCSA
jgi:hypothetical protein